MPSRRTFLMTSVATAGLGVRGAWAQGDGFAQFLSGLRGEARRSGISAATVDRAFAGLTPNAKVLELDRKQPEFVMTWDRYRTTRLSDARVAAGRQALAANRGLVRDVASAYGVTPSILMGIWGLESNYGATQGGFGVVEALATLAWEGRRASFFRGEVIAALRILEHGDITPERMTGSYAGAMGQPQFMPSSFQRFAVDFDGDGRRDIWGDTADVLASMANYLARSGWHAGEGWGVPVRLPPSFDPGSAGRETRLPVTEWQRMGVQPLAGARWPRPDVQASVILPDQAGGDAFLTTPNFLVIRRYNPSDFYALAVGMLGDLVTA